jgi:hypothetical protein
VNGNQRINLFIAIWTVALFIAIWTVALVMVIWTISQIIRLVVSFFW